MGPAFIYFPTPSWKKLFNRVKKLKIWWQMKNETVVDEPVVDQSSPVETCIVPDDNVPGLLWAIHLLGWSENIV